MNRATRPSICICSSYDNGFAEIGDHTSRTLVAYGKRHGYPVEVVRNVAIDRHPAWHRLKLIEQLFDRGYDYVLWIDADAYFSRFDVDVGSIINGHADLYLVQHDHPSFRPVAVPNTGVMLVRNSTWSRALLNKLWSMVRYLNHPWWENAALIKFLGYNSLLKEGPDNVNWKALDHISFVPEEWNSLSVSGAPIIVHLAGISREVRRQRIPAEVERALQRFGQKIPQQSGNGGAVRLNRHQLLKSGIYVQKMTPQARMLDLIRRLRPVATSIDLIRVGGDKDGGYLIPGDLAGILACFSSGVGPTASFETELLTRYGIPSHLCDYSVAVPPDNFMPASFERKFVGAFDDDTFTTLNQWMERKPEYGLDGDFLLQMDMEGGEYAALLSLDESKLKRFRIIVMEFHYIEHWGDPALFGLVKAVFTKLLKWFHVIHFHPNNYGSITQLGGIRVPQVFELSLIRKDRVTLSGVPAILPHPLDRPCNPDGAELPIPASWFS